MINEQVRQSQRYQETLGRGRMGEDFLMSVLSERLEGSGLSVRLATEHNHKEPFDIEILDQDRVLVGIENKDLSPKTQGTWIKNPAKRRKLKYAEEHGFKLVLTTVTIRETEDIWFREGLVNGVPRIFDYNVEHLVDKIIDVRGRVKT